METVPAPLESEAIAIQVAVTSLAEADPLHACKILIIDDEEPNVHLLERVLAQAGFDNFISITDSSDAAGIFADFEPDLVLTDWLMPGLDGCAVIGQLRALMATDDYLPIVVLTADVTPQTRQRALTAGATDFLTKPFDKIEVVLRIQNLLNARLSHLTVQAQNAGLEESVRQRTIELEHALTELQQMQRQVIQQERLAALGTMAGGIAHDFNNALSIIMGFTELLLRDAKHGLSEDVATPSLTTILTAAEDGARIVHRLREFYRPDEAQDQRQPLDLNHLIEQAISLTQPRWHTGARASGREIMVVRELEQIPEVLGDAAELREALTNLIFNAVDAVPQSGTITFRSRCEGEYVAVEITDTGSGMSEEVREHCLEPFFSTKGQRGTGLGLSMVFGILHRHAGSIDVVSAPGQGTTFTLRLPVSESPSVRGPATVAESIGPFHVLVVDDQLILSQLLCEYLHEDFHTTETAHNACEALEKFAAGNFDVVITDHVMAGMTGDQLALALKKLDPQVPVILLTGYAGDFTAGGPAAAIDLLLAKPLSRADLRQALARVVGGVCARS